MKNKKTSLVVVGIVVVAAFLAVRPILGQVAKPATAVPSVAGRYQVVNGTPDQARHIMLLDTLTGDTWMICDRSDNSTAWCKMPRVDAPSKSDR